MFIYDYFTLDDVSLNQKYFLVRVMNLHVKMCNCSLLASVETLINVYFVSLVQGTFDCSSNTTKTIQILRFLYIWIYRCFLFIWFQRLYNIWNSISVQMASMRSHPQNQKRLTRHGNEINLMQAPSKTLIIIWSNSRYYKNSLEDTIKAKMIKVFIILVKHFYWNDFLTITVKSNLWK